MLPEKTEEGCIGVTFRDCAMNEYASQRKSNSRSSHNEVVRANFLHRVQSLRFGVCCHELHGSGVSTAVSPSESDRQSSEPLEKRSRHAFQNPDGLEFAPNRESKSKRGARATIPHLSSASKTANAPDGRAAADAESQHRARVSNSRSRGSLSASDVTNGRSFHRAARQDTWGGETLLRSTLIPPHTPAAQYSG